MFHNMSSKCYGCYRHLLQQLGTSVTAFVPVTKVTANNPLYDFFTPFFSYIGILTVTSVTGTTFVTSVRKCCNRHP